MVSTSAPSSMCGPRFLKQRQPFFKQACKQARTRTLVGLLVVPFPVFCPEPVSLSDAARMRVER
jgi:hypothetical protein